MRILVVEDSEPDRILLSRILEMNGFEVETAPEGQTALEMVHSDRPDLVITDIMMPVMDGFRLCRELKKDSLTKDIPLIFYTASYKEGEDKKLAMGMGADAFLIKPEEPKKIVEKVNE